jgi:hypothetical protein
VSHLSSALEVLGLLALSAAGFLVHPALGLFALGAVLIAAGLALAPSGSNKGGS